jgi:hypothetical protein
VAVAASPALAPPATSLTARAAPRTGGRWFTLGATYQPGELGYGARATADLFSFHQWTLGVTVGMSKSKLTHAFVDMAFVDARALATLARTFGLGAWRLRVEASGGVVRTSADGYLDNYQTHQNGVFPMGEAAALFSRNLGEWGVSVGPVLGWYQQKLAMGVDGYAYDYTTRDIELTVFAGMTRRM